MFVGWTTSQLESVRQKDLVTDAQCAKHIMGGEG
jgi:hypothetical protein